MNIKELIYFIKVIETGNFTDAADICCVTQPTLSAGIKKLEEELDTQLIIRGTKNTGGIRPTVAGTKILEIAKTIYHEADKIKRIAKATKNPFVQDLRIGAFPTLCPYLMPKILPAFKKHLSEMRFFIIEEKSDSLVALLEQHKLDMVFLTLPYDNIDIKDNHPFLIKHPLFFDPFYLAISEDDPLDDVENITLEDMAPNDMLLLDEGHCLRSQALSFCEIAPKNQTDFRGTSLETLLSMVRMGTGYTLVPQIAIDAYSQGIKFIPLKDPSVGRMIYCIFNSYTLPDVVIEHCKSFMVDFF